MTRGTCRQNLTWTLDDDGTLTISGRGKMYDYWLRSDVPWASSHELIRKVILEVGVTTIGDWAFSDCKRLTSVKIPDSVTAIGSHAFSDCTSLLSLIIPDSVTTIGAGAFRKCTSLTNVMIPDSVTTIGAGAFRKCTSLTNVMIPDSVTAIGAGAFNWCTGLTNVMIPDSVTAIGAGAFNWCTGLTSVIIPDSVTTISNWAFCACKSLTSIKIPDSVTTISNWAFCACKSLTSVIIPDSVATIGRYAFSNCKNLTNVMIPDSVTTIGAGAFRKCTSLKEIYYPSGRGFEEVLSQDNNAKLIPYDELPPELKADESVAEFDKTADTKENVKPPAQVKQPAQIEPSFNLTPLPTQASPVDSPPPAEKICTVYRNTKISRSENIAPPDTKSLSRVDENIAEIRRAAELAAMNIVMTIERDLGFSPEDVSSQNLGYDIKSTSRDEKTSRLIEVKGRHIDAETVTVSRNEIDAALNNPDNFILAIVRLDGGKNETFYIRKPFEQPPDKAALSVNFSIQKLVEVSNVPG